MDAAFKSAPYSGYTTGQLETFVAEYDPAMAMDKARAPAVIEAMKGEITRRAKVAAGDMSVMTDGERLRYVR